MTGQAAGTFTQAHIWALSSCLEYKNSTFSTFLLSSVTCSVWTGDHLWSYNNLSLLSRPAKSTTTLALIKCFIPILSEHVFHINRWAVGISFLKFFDSVTNSDFMFWLPPTVFPLVKVSHCKSTSKIPQKIIFSFSFFSSWPWKNLSAPFLNMFTSMTEKGNSQSLCIEKLNQNSCRHVNTHHLMTCLLQVATISILVARWIFLLHWGLEFLPLSGLLQEVTVCSVSYMNEWTFCYQTLSEDIV